MAALSFCSNWESPLQQLNSEMLSYGTSFHNQQQAQQVLLPQLDETISSFNYSSCFEFPDPFLPPADESFPPDVSYPNLLPYFSSSSDDALISLSPEIFPVLEGFEYSKSYQLPKRLKNNYHYDSNFATNYFHSYVPNPPTLVPEFISEIPAPVTTSKTESTVKKQNGSSLSVQTIAARERRRKITEKTQELGKLIPGGHRMTTAEMFQAASKYVKFLQAQVKLLQLMEPKQEMKEASHASQELQNLLASPTIQEKFYSEEKCLVPKGFVETLTNDPEIQLKPMVVQGIDQLLRTDGES